MNGFENDIDGKTALAWRKLNVASSLASSSKNIKTKRQLYDTISKCIIQFSREIYGDKDDQRYTRIIDLVMLRIKSDLDHINLFSIDSHSIESLIEIELQNAYDEYKKDIKYGDFIKAVSTKVIQHISEDENANVESEVDRQTSNKRNRQQSADSYHSEKHSSEIVYSDVFSRIFSKTNDIICTMSFEISQQFSKLEKLIMNRFAIMSPDIYESKVIDTVNRLKNLQIGDVQIQLLSVNINGKEPRFKDKKKKKEVDIIFAGMKFSSKMIEDLSSDAMNMVLNSALLVKQRNDDIMSSLCTIGLYAKENAKYTIKLIKQISRSEYLKKFSYLFKRIYKLLREKLIIPLKQLMIKFIMSKLPDSWKRFFEKVVRPLWTKICAAVRKAKEYFKMLVDAFIAALKIAWKIIKNVFIEVVGWIKAAINKALTLLKDVVNPIINGFKVGLRFLFKALVAAMEGLVKLIIWAIKLAVQGLMTLAKLAWEKLMNSKFGHFLKKAWNALTKPFKALGHKIGETFKKIRNAFKKAKNAVVNKVKALAGKIKSKVNKVFSSVKKFFGKIGGAVKKGLYKVGQFLGKHIRNAFNKIPGAKYIKKWATKIFKMIGKKLFKKKSEDILKNKISKKIIYMIGNVIKNMILSTPTAIISALSLAWTLWNLFNTYNLVKDLFKPIAEENGYNTSSPAWFEKYMIDYVLPQVLISIFTGSPGAFMWQIYCAIKDMVLDAFRKVHYLALTSQQRIEVWYENCLTYARFKTEFNEKYKHIDANNPENIDSFVKNQYDSYKSLIKFISIIKDQNEKINYYNEILHSNYEEEYEKNEIRKWGHDYSNKIPYLNRQQLKEYLEKNKYLTEKIAEVKHELPNAKANMFRHLQDKMSTITAIVQYATQSGMDWYIPGLHSFVNQRDFENYDDFFIQLYKEAYSGIKYLELFKSKKEINARIKEKVDEQRMYHATHDFNIDELKRAMKDIVDERKSFEHNAEDVNGWLNNCQNLGSEAIFRLKQHLRYMFKIEDDDGIIPEYEYMPDGIFDLKTYS